MPNVTLDHCQPVVIVAYDDPTDVTLHLDVGGNAGDGVVEVIVAPPRFPDAPRLPTGSSSTAPIGAVTSVALHYRSAGPAKPQQVPVAHTP